MFFFCPCLVTTPLAASSMSISEMTEIEALVEKILHSEEVHGPGWTRGPSGPPASVGLQRTSLRQARLPKCPRARTSPVGRTCLSVETVPIMAVG